MPPGTSKIDSNILAQPGTNVIDAQRTDLDLKKNLEALLDASASLPRDGDYCKLSIANTLFENTAKNSIVRRSMSNSPWFLSQIIAYASNSTIIDSTKGRHYREQRNYDEAEKYFSLALNKYNGLINGDLSNHFGVSYWIKRQQIRFSPEYVNGLIRGKLLAEINQELYQQFKMEIENIKLLMLRPDKIITDEMAAGKIDQNTLKQKLSTLANTINNIRTGLEDHNDVTISKYMYKTRSYSIHAFLLIEIAKRLSLKNPDLAKTAIKGAIDICIKQLSNMPPNMAPDIVYSFFSTLAWAYNMRASLLEKAEPGSGANEALKAAAIYTWLLHGEVKLNSDTALKGSISDLWAILNKFSGAMSQISNNYKNLSKGKPIRISGIDILQRNATNEMELSLSLVDALTTARRFTEANNECDNIISTKAKLNGTYQLRPSFLARIQAKKANVILQMISRSYPITKNAEETLIKINEAYALAKKAVDWFNTTMNIQPNACSPTSICGINGSPTSTEHNLFAYYQSLSTLAWAHSFRGTIAKEESGEGKADFNAALELYKKISQCPVREDRKLIMQIETNLTPSALAQRRAELLANLERYSEAIADFETIGSDETNYNNAQISILEAKIALAKITFTSTGKTIIDELNNIQNAANGISNRLNKTQKLQLLMLKAQIYGTTGWQHIQNLDRTKANGCFDKAIDIFRALANSPDAGQKYALSELCISKGNLLYSIAELMKIRFERELENLEQVETAFKTAETQFKTEKNDRGGIISMFGLAETSAYKIKLLLRNNELGKVQSFLKNNDLLDGIINNTKCALEKGSFRLAFRGAQILSMIYAVRGGIQDILVEEGKGKENFLIASDILRAVLGQDRIIFAGIDQSKLPAYPVELLESLRSKSTQLTSNNLLLLAETSINMIKLNSYEVIKAAGVKTKAILSKVIELFNSLDFSKDTNTKIKHLIDIGKHQAKIAGIEASVMLGQLFEEDGELTKAQAQYKSILQQINTIMTNLIKLGNPDTLNLAAINTRAFGSLTWALNSLGNINSEIENIPDDVKQPEIIASLLLYYSLLGGKHCQKPRGKRRAKTA
ncbi:MAG: hypothetical protein FD145_280 [Candidatus Saganbacteria bacterium]|uniref:Tetratricopeptide repeat protein n=1 Tax=Candidatus Saganbacteria bacterium TaxID=2575572 RepID=A0A833L2G9_UNCSA|nr:MAG: hypothetical protein FD145_280 [Candidatus Saganbacteria bacterium]